MESKNKIAIITGATGTLGQSITRAFAGSGYNLLLLGTSKTRLENLSKSIEKTDSQKVLFHEVNLNDVSEDALLTVREKCLKELGSPTALVCNAGVTGEVGKSYEIPAKKFMEAFSVNLFSTIELCRVFVPVFVKAKYGKIITVSGGGATSPRENFSPYSLSKTALVRFCETLAVELNALRPLVNIDVNSIAPGVMKSRMTEDILSLGAERIGATEFETLSKKLTEGKVTAPEIPAKLALYLASPETDGITGKLISAVWDNWSILHNYKEELAKSDVFTLRRISPKNKALLTE